MITGAPTSLVVCVDSPSRLLFPFSGTNWDQLAPLASESLAASSAPCEKRPPRKTAPGPNAVQTSQISLQNRLASQHALAGRVSPLPRSLQPSTRRLELILAPTSLLPFEEAGYHLRHADEYISTSLSSFSSSTTSQSAIKMMPNGSKRAAFLNHPRRAQAEPDSPLASPHHILQRFHATNSERHRHPHREAWRQVVPNHRGDSSQPNSSRLPEPDSLT